MTAIWRNDGDCWQLASPVGFPAEAKLHDLVHDAPQLLPLAGAPRLVMLGREVRCGSGTADLVAVERSGRLVLIEVKLAANNEARRAVVAQLLSYAAALRGSSVADLDALLRPHLPDGHETVIAAVGGAVQEGDFDAATVEETLAESMATGRFRLVFVLDSAPDDLVRLVGYLEDLTDAALIIDLITVAEYDAGGTRILVPQRVEPARWAEQDRTELKRSPISGPRPVTTEGVEVFVASIADAADEAQASLTRLAEWAQTLESQGLARLFSTRGTSGRTTLVPRLNGYDAGMVTIVNENAGPVLWLWRSVIETRAPNSLPTIEASLGSKVLQGSSSRNFDESVLQALRQAHEEAAHAQSR